MQETREVDTPGKARFTLWREVVVAYAAPASIAGIGGLISGQASLLVSAGTSIGISSAVVAALIGAWLQRSGHRYPWLSSGPRLPAIATIAIGAALLGGLAGWLVNIGIDLPVSAAIAATIITWRWRSARQA